MEIKDLSADQCILLTAYYASEANIPALHSFTPTRLDVLDPELVLRVVLTCLPETVDPKLYTTYTGEVASRLYLDVEREDIEVDLSPVKDLTPSQARKQVKALDLLEIRPPKFPPHAPSDILTRFLCHRAYRIESESGALNLIPDLIEPFLERCSFVRTWYISVVLPVLRLNFDYYPTADTTLTLTEFELMRGREGVDHLLEKSTTTQEQTVTRDDGTQIGVITRDMRGLVGPWMYGHTERKRRRLNDTSQVDGHDDEITTGMRKVSLSGVAEADKTGHDWEYVYRWIVNRAETRFPLITQLIEEWEGPSDVDLGGFAKGSSYLDPDVQQKLESQYAQAAFASCYAAQADSEETIRGAHGVLARLAELLDFIPPPDLATSVESLPQIEQHAVVLDESHTVKDMAPVALLTPEHPLTTPRMETYMLLQMMVYSAYQLAGLGHSISIINVAKLQFYSTAEQQLVLLRQILKGLSKSGRRDDLQWTADRAKLIWLWSWGIKSEQEDASTGAGVLGKIHKSDFEAELLRALVDTSCYKLAAQIIVSDAEATALSRDRAETVVYDKIMDAYDSASNGNKTRGGMKKANDILVAFRKHFQPSRRFDEAAALIAATHALSFYSLTLQHGVPFQPVNIRAAQDPVELIDKVLEQNPKSFAHLDDLIGVANNFVLAGLPTGDSEDDEDALQNLPEKERILKLQKNGSRRVTFMAVEAALREDDFETAYSYIVNRLTPSSVTEARPQIAKHVRNGSRNSTASKAAEHEDDISWRAAYLAGRYRPSTSTPPSLRRLEQRKELLSLALLLAPTTVLTDVLSAWRRCEEETTTLLAAQQQEEHDFDDHADRREPSLLPGHFTVAGDQPRMILNQKTREIGRMTSPGKDSDAPLSMFDLTRNAARALSRNVNLGQTGDAGSREASLDLQRDDEDGEQRVRRRDMVANAVSGGLANGLGWVLGAKPTAQQRQ